MLLARIQQQLGEYKQWLRQHKSHPALSPWETVQFFQANWNPEDRDPVVMYERCLQNTETRRQWQTEQWYPKKMMLEFWRFEPGTVKLMFDDLFNETKEVEARIGRFLFGCDTLLRDYKSAHPTTVENNHYHSDFRMIALYLSCRYPDQYAPYSFAPFQAAMTQFGARDVPQQNDLGRYFKVMRTLNTFLEKDGEVLPLLQKQLHPKRHYQGKSLLAVADFVGFAGR